MTPTPNPDLEKKLITIASGKGGVGKTWLSTTLAHMLARMGRRVLLFDGDLGLANVDIQLGLTPQRDIGDVISGKYSIKDAITRYDEEDFGAGCFDVLAGKSGSGALGSLTRETLVALRSGLIEAAADYDHVILDLAAGIDPSVTTLSRHKGRIFTVMSPDPTSLTDAYAFIKLTVQRMPEADIRIVVNQAGNRREGERTYEAIRKVCQTFLKTNPPLAAVVRQDSKVRDAIRHQVPLLVRHPQSEAAEGIGDIIRLLTAPAMTS
ncbi:site-determining protein [Iodidimonas nitroreducens]|uniref:Site-determining protein n=1 Tax=Iodidimonas nitroreducens TaxID=1236968 RepID=A0A5A7NEK5_9PROT|nr:MinD/ParA family protein [Iodidimonas nitroreducens]GAK33072.1 flagellum site-determining protein YlxH [alpha proteobacterium Q-1]GER05499.1 site-determining protein [Iodidimonas nitroreducens]